jgi:polysaccharide export outer membrane protein
MARFVFSALLAMLLMGCASTPPIGGSAVEVMSYTEMPGPTRADLSTNSRPYLIGPFDKLKIDVFGVDDLSREVQIDASGRLSFPLIGVVEAAGRTPAELATEVEQRLRGRFVRNPQVTVNLEETVSQVITVDGEVGRPGLYPVVGRMTLMRAVATAGGTDEYASLDDVIIFREVDGQRLAGVYNLKGIRRGNYADPEVYANDVIVVGDSPSRRMLDQVFKIIPTLTTPLILLLRNSN